MKKLKLSEFLENAKRAGALLEEANAYVLIVIDDLNPKDDQAQLAAHKASCVSGLALGDYAGILWDSVEEIIDDARERTRKKPSA